MVPFLMWLCMILAGGTFVYAMYAAFVKKKDGDVSLDSTLRKLSTGIAQADRVKESSRIVTPTPDMTRPTDAEEEHVAAQPLEDSSEDEAFNVMSEFDELPAYQADYADEAAGVEEAAIQSDDILEEQELGDPVPEPKPVEEVKPHEYESSVEEETDSEVKPDFEQLGSQPGPEADEGEYAQPVAEAGSFLNGLDEDVKSNYEERQKLDSEADVLPQEPLEDSSEDEVFNVMSEFGEMPAYQADYADEAAGTEEAAVESDDVLQAEDEAEQEESVPDAEEVGNVFDSFGTDEQEEDADNLGVTPDEISAAFENLEEKAKTEHHEEESPEEEQEGEEEDDRDKSAGDGSLFG